MRRMEILSIGLKDIDLERRVIHIPNTEAGPRDQPIGPDLAEYLGGLLASVAPGQVWLFPANSACGHGKHRAILSAGRDGGGA